MSEESTQGRGFEPARHLTRVSGAEYLEVKWRLVWFRDQHPHGSVDTELIRYDAQEAVVKATVTVRDDQGKPLGSATGYGSEKPGDFRDFLEKAETKAIGRALAALGFGTQFAFDFEDGATANRPVDAPVRRDGGQRQPTQMRPQQSQQAPRTTSQNVSPMNRPQSAPPDVARANQAPAERRSVDDHNAPTPRQLSYLRGIAREASIDETQLDHLARQVAGSVVSQLDRRGVSVLIEHVNGLRQTGGLVDGSENQ